MINDSILWLAFNIAIVSVCVSILTLVGGRCIRSLPTRHAVLVAGMVGCLLTPLAVTVGWIGNWGCIPEFAILDSTDRPAVVEEAAGNELTLDLAQAEDVGQRSSIGQKNQVSIKSPTRNLNQSRHLPDDEFVAGPRPRVVQSQLSQPAKNEMMHSEMPTIVVSKSVASTTFRMSKLVPVIPFLGQGLLAVWATVALLIASLRIYQWVRCRRLIEACVELKDPSLKRLIVNNASRLGMKHPPRTYESPAAPFPFVVGFLRPSLIVPMSFSQASSKKQFELMLLHELSHVRRKDHWTLLLQVIVGIAFWWNPFIQLIGLQVSRVRELICDDVAIQSGGSWRDYAQTMVSIAETTLGRSSIPRTSALAMSAGDLEQRVARILSNEGKTVSTQASRPSLFVIAIMASICALAMVFAQVPASVGEEEVRVSQVVQPEESKPVDRESEVAVVQPIRQNEAPETKKIDKAGGPLREVRGVVLDINGNPAVNATVQVVAVPKRVVGEVQTDAEGVFQFACNPSQVWRSIAVTSEDGQHRALSEIGVFNDRSSTPLELEFKLEEMVERTVVVTDENSVLLPNVNVTVLLDLMGFHRLDGMTDANGEFVFKAPVSTKVSQLIALADGYGLDYRSYEQVDGTENQTEPVKPDFPAGQKETLVLSNPAPFTVKVVDQDGNPIAGVGVSPWLLDKPNVATLNLSSMALSLVRKTDMTGEATFEWFPNWQKQPVTLWPNKEGFDRPRSSYSPAADEGFCEIKLTKLTKVSGKVFDQAGQPVSGIRVRYDGRKAHEQIDFTTTKSDGSFKFFVRPDQEIIVAVHELGSKQVTNKRVSNFQKLMISSPDKPLENCDLKLVKPVRIKGRLVNAKTNRLVSGNRMAMSRYAMTPKEYSQLVLQDPKWHVLADDQGGSSEHWHKVPSIWGGGIDTETGEFEMNLSPGVYSLRPNDDDRSIRFVVTEQDEMKIDFETKAGAIHQIKGNVMLNGKPVPNANILATNTRYRGDRWEGIANDQGVFSADVREESGVIVAFSADKKFGVVKTFGEGTRSMDLQLQPVGKIKGRLLDEQLRPISNARVYFGNKAYRPEYGGFVVTDNNGVFQIDKMCANFGFELFGVYTEGDRRISLGKFTPLQPAESRDLGELQLVVPIRFRVD